MRTGIECRMLLTRPDRKDVRTSRERARERMVGSGVDGKDAHFRRPAHLLEKAATANADTASRASRHNATAP
eukprot:351669-Chlamydomonas_euryale.AAC.5